ncbi:MAG: hypothetical protein H0T89_08675 [Deltaproteobacteria bacterium]|nr:hypothetical protein [Deltaproteobacteria bacterium]MDQ3295038.1 hypothetical protein [Myxococcota bacterium]
MRTALVASLLTISLSLGCGTSGDDANEDGGTPENPVPAKTSPYQLQTRIDFTVEAVLPPQIASAVATLRTFSTNPGKALFDLAEQQGVPAVGIIRDVLPAVLEDKLEGWINDEVAKVKINGKPIMTYAGELAMLAEFALSEFAVDSEMSILGPEVTHRLAAIDLTPAGIDFKLPIGGLAGDILTQQPSIEVVEGGFMSFGEQHFGLNYGEYAWQGLEHASTSLFGADIRTTLGNAINCPALANAIASKCVLNACVGHATEIKAICNGGLDALVDITHDRIAAFRLEVFHFASGTAQLVDDDADGYGDRIIDGVWDAELNIGLGLRHAPASFSGSR